MRKRRRKRQHPTEEQLRLWRLTEKERRRKLLEKAEEKEPEMRDGRTYRVVSLPDQQPPKSRSKRTHYHFKDVGKQGQGRK